MPALRKKVLRDISHRKARTLLTIIGITIARIGLSAINIASSQFEQSLAFSSNITSQADIQIYKSGPESRQFFQAGDEWAFL